MKRKQKTGKERKRKERRKETEARTKGAQRAGNKDELTKKN